MFVLGGFGTAVAPLYVIFTGEVMGCPVTVDKAVLDKFAKDGLDTDA